MHLKELEIKWFKCFRDSWKIPFHNLTVLIWENDAWKTTILDGLDFLLNNKNPKYSDDIKESDYRLWVDSIEITWFFIIENPSEELKKFLSDCTLTFKKTFNKTWSTSCEIFVECFDDNELEVYNSYSAVELKTLLAKLWLKDKSSQDLRKTAVKEHIEQNISTLVKIKKWKEVRFSEISGYLPIFQKYSSSEYWNPENSIRKTLELVYKGHFYDVEGEWEDVLKKDFKKLKESILKDLNNKVESNLLEHIQRYTPQIRSIWASCDIDFTRGLSYDWLFIKDTNWDEKSLSQIGEGSKKKVFLSILEWDSEVNLSTQQWRSIIRWYDEPDAHLHYDAQRKMFYVIKNLSENQNSNIQSVICTHSLSMIDRAPASSINHIIKDDSTGESKVNYLVELWEEEISQFLDTISEISWIKNSNIFYEKCFLLVEWPSEQNALPVMYKKITGRSFSEDWVILINLETNWQWSNALKFLQTKKEKCTVMLLDTDTQETWSGNQVTKEKLQQVGFQDDFLKNNCFFIGTKEFEDSILDSQYVKIFNAHFSKTNGENWVDNEFASIRSSDKFSNKLCGLVYNNSSIKWGKPDIALATAKELTKEEINNIEPIRKLFKKISDIIN